MKLKINQKIKIRMKKIVDFKHVFLLLLILSMFYFIIGSFVAYYLDRILSILSDLWKNPDDSKKMKIVKLTVLSMFQTFFIILTVHLIRKLFKYLYNENFRKHFGDYNLPEIDGIILLGSLYVIFSINYKKNLNDLVLLLN